MKKRERIARRCAFTGHRMQKMPFGFDESDPRCLALKRRLYDEVERLIADGYAEFLSGGAQGADLFLAEAVLSLRRKYPWIALEVVVPYDGQADRWPEALQSRYRRVLVEADQVTRIGRAYTRNCLFRRNAYLVNHADLLLAVYDGQPGGTAMTVEYAHARGVPVIEGTFMEEERAAA